MPLRIQSNRSINILGVLFNSKLQWSDHMALTIKKSRSALNAIQLIRKFFNQRELLQLITSNFYSILFYNAEIWHVPCLNSNLKQKLISALANALKICWKKLYPFVSFKALHMISKRATPEKLMQYKLALYPAVVA